MPRVKLTKESRFGQVGETPDLVSDAYAAALAEGVAEPFHSVEEQAAGAPPREKAALRRAPEREARIRRDTDGKRKR